MDWLTGDRIAWLLGLIALAAALLRIWRWVRRSAWPWWRAVRQDMVAIRDTLLGRGPQFDSITQEETAPRLPSIGVQMANTRSQLEFAIGKLHEIEHEVKNNDGSSLKDSVDRIEATFTSILQRLQDGDTRFGEMAGELSQLRQTLGTLAEAQPQLWSAIEAIARSQPPDDDLEQPDL